MQTFAQTNEPSALTKVVITFNLQPEWGAVALPHVLMVGMWSGEVSKQYVNKLVFDTLIPVLSVCLGIDHHLACLINMAICQVG